MTLTLTVAEVEQIASELYTTSFERSRRGDPLWVWDGDEPRFLVYGMKSLRSERDMMTRFAIKASDGISDSEWLEGRVLDRDLAFYGGRTTIEFTSAKVHV